MLFGAQKLSIASLSDGKVKHIIDCLYPLIGGKKGAPEDHRIVELYVVKSVPGLNNDQVQITIWEDTEGGKL